jgi:opacity protein-like surface antigen
MNGRVYMRIWVYAEFKRFTKMLTKEFEMKKPMFAAAVLAVVAAPSFAGGPVAVAEEPAPVAPVAPVVQAVDWTGGYVGLSFGAASGDADLPATSFDYDDGTSVGIFGGYNVQSGSLVYGGELGYSSVSDVVYAGAGTDNESTFDSMVDLRGRLGYAAGNALLYGALGYAWGETTINGVDTSADGWTFGVGVDYLVSDAVFVGLDWTSRNLDGTYEGTDETFDFDTSLNTLGLRVGLKF